MLRDGLLVTFQRPSIDTDGTLAVTQQTVPLHGARWSNHVMHFCIPYSTTRYNPEASWAICVHDAASIPKAAQYSGTQCGKRFAGWSGLVSPPIITPRMTMLGRRSSCICTRRGRHTGEHASSQQPPCNRSQPLRGPRGTTACGSRGCYGLMHTGTSAGTRGELPAAGRSYWAKTSRSSSRVT